MVDSERLAGRAPDATTDGALHQLLRAPTISYLSLHFTSFFHFTSNFTSLPDCRSRATLALRFVWRRQQHLLESLEVEPGPDGGLLGVS